jgi:hypothetical protein
MMKRLIPLVAAATFFACGCTTVLKSKEFGDVKTDGGSTPVAAVEIENSVWLLFNFIPVASGSPDHPNLNRCKVFRNTVNLPNNMKVLEKEMACEGVEKVVNLTSHYTSESYLFFLLARRACHTSAVLVKSDAKDRGKSK